MKSNLPGIMDDVDRVDPGRLLRRASIIFMIVGIAVSLLLIFLANQTSPITIHREVTILVEAPSLATLIDDSTAIHYLLASGVKGIVLKPSTLGGILSGREATMASGEEILRLFRMEGIVNIWMWEEIKDKPIRADATYVFTNSLSLFENVLSALTERLGSASVKPYRTPDHDFGGDIPGNYIIEVLAPMEELRSVAIGLDKSNRDRLATTTLLPVIEISNSEDVKSLPRNTEAILVSSTTAAQAAFSVLSPTSVFLSKGVANPGWSQAVRAFRSGELDSPLRLPQAQAVIAPVTDVLRVISDLKNSGYTVSPPASSRIASLTTESSWTGSSGGGGGEVPAGADNHFKRFKKFGVLEIAGYIILIMGGLWFFFQAFYGGRKTDDRESPDDRGRTTVLPGVVAGAYLILAFLMRSTVLFPEVFGVGIIAIFVIAFARHLHSLSLGDVMLQTALLLSMTLMAGELIAPGRSAPSPWVSVLVAMAVYAAICVERPDGRTGSPGGTGTSGFLLCGIALAATRVLPEDPLVLALALIPLGIFTVWTGSSGTGSSRTGSSRTVSSGGGGGGGSDDRLQAALQLFILPAALTPLLNKEITLSMRCLLAVWLLLGILAPIFWKRRTPGPSADGGVA